MVVQAFQCTKDCQSPEGERFAPGFPNRILKPSVVVAASELSLHNENLIGGGISGGANDLGQVFVRPETREAGCKSR